MYSPVSYQTIIVGYCYTLSEGIKKIDGVDIEAQVIIKIDKMDCILNHNNNENNDSNI